MNDVTIMIFMILFLFSLSLLQTRIGAEYYYDYGNILYVDLNYKDFLLDSYEYDYGPASSWGTKVLSTYLTIDESIVHARPGLNERYKTNVSVTVRLIGVTDLDEQRNQYKVSLELAQKWHHPRWELNRIGSPLQFLDLDATSLIGRLWTPGAYFVNEAGRFESENFRWAQPSALHRFTRLNRNMRIHSDGTMLFVQRLTLYLICNLDLRRYPLDEQKCPIQISSFPHTTEEVLFHWSTDGVLFNAKEAGLVEYDVTKIDTSSCKVTSKSSDPSDVYPCVQAEIYIKRKLGSYLLQFYLPSLFFVVLSWMTFWVDIDAVVARISFAIFLVVNMAAQMMFVLKRLPPVAYVKALDVWMVACLMFIGGALIEYAMIKVQLRKVAVKTGRRMSSFFPRVSSDEEDEFSESSGEILEVPAVTQRDPVPDLSSDKSAELPAVTFVEREPTSPPASFSAIFSGSDESVDLEAVIARKAGRTAAQFTPSTTPRSAIKKPPIAQHARAKRVSLKIPRNPTRRQKITFRIRKKIERLQTNKALMLDVMSRILFPFGFAIFNVIYWTYYLSTY